MIGLEPTNGGTTTHCLNHLATPASMYYNYSIDRRIWESSFISYENRINIFLNFKQTFI